MHNKSAERILAIKMKKEGFNKTEISGDLPPNPEQQQKARRDTLFSRSLLRGESSHDRLQRLADEVKKAHDFILENQDALVKRGHKHKTDDFLDEYKKVLQLHTAAWEAYNQNSPNKREAIGKFENMSKEFFAKHNHLLHRVLLSSSYHHILQDTWTEMLKQRQKEELAGHTAIASSSTDEIAVEDSHSEMDHPHPTENADRAWGKVQSTFPKLKEVKERIAKISQQLTVNENEKKAIEKIQAYLDTDSATIEGHNQKIKELTSEIYSALYKDLDNKKEDGSKQVMPDNSTNIREITSDKTITEPIDNNQSTSEKINPEELKNMKDYAKFKLSDNEKQYTRLQESLKKANEEKEKLQNEIIEIWKNRQEPLEPHSPREITDKDTNEAQTLVNSLKKQMVEAIKEHEAILKRIKENQQINPDRWALYQKERDATDRVHKLMIDLAKAEKELDYLKKQRPTRENQPSATLEESQLAQAEIEVWDLRISQYKNNLVIDHLNKKLKQNVDNLGLISKEKISRPKITESDDISEPRNKFRSWITDLKICKNKLLSIIYNPQADRDFQGILEDLQGNFRQSLDERNTKLQVIDLQGNEGKVICLEKIEDGLEKEKALFKANLKRTEDLKKYLDNNEKNSEKTVYLKEEIAELIKGAKGALSMIEEGLQVIANKKRDAQHNLETLQGVLADAKKWFINDLLPKALPGQYAKYSSWYMQIEYITDKYTYGPSIPGSCTLGVTKMMMNDLGIPTERIPDLQIAGALNMRDSSSNLFYIPIAFRKLGVTEEYSAVFLKTIEELENILAKDKRSIAIDINYLPFVKSKTDHACLVDKIEEQAGWKFVYYRDPDGGKSKCERIDVFRERYSEPLIKCIVPTKALNKRQYLIAQLVKQWAIELYQGLTPKALNMRRLLIGLLHNA